MTALLETCWSMREVSQFRSAELGGYEEKAARNGRAR